jgi:hypothetical protein
LQPFRSPSSACAGAAVLLAVGALFTVVTPALAAAPGTDLALAVTGTTIAADAAGKFGSLTVSNVGTEKPPAVLLSFDLSDLDLSKVELDLGTCDKFDDEIRCGLADAFVPGPGATADLDLPFVRKAGATGAAGTLTVALEVSGDTNAKNDTITADVSVGGGGVDLTVVAEDVYAIDAAGKVTAEPLAPGEVSTLVGHVLNQGDMTAAGIGIEVELPEHAAFAEEVPGCTYGADRRTATCSYGDLNLIPADLDGSGEFLDSGRDFSLTVRVDDDAPAGAVLKDGLFTANALDSVPADAASVTTLRRKPARQPAGVRALTASAVKDVDDSDNNDEFAVFVAPEESGGSGGGGGLPVTGPQAAVLGGGGLAVAVAGALLFLLARRRRVVLVNPGDERVPTG